MLLAAKSFIKTQISVKNGHGHGQFCLIVGYSFLFARNINLFRIPLVLKKPKWHACGKNIICILEFSLCRTAVKVLNRRTRVRILISATCQTEKSIRLTGGNNKFISFQGQVHQIGRIILHYKLYSLHSDNIIIVLVALGLRTIRSEKVVPVMYVSSWNKHHKKGLDNSRKLQFSW